MAGFLAPFAWRSGIKGSEACLERMRPFRHCIPAGRFPGDEDTLPVFDD